MDFLEQLISLTQKSFQNGLFYRRNSSKK